MRQNHGKEGELSYHARLWEGNCSAFLTPEDGKIYLIDDGRCVMGTQFYRNEMGEVFDPSSTKKWANFWFNEEYGGKKIMALLKK